MLQGYPKEIMCKNGTPILLRPLTAEDEKNLTEFYGRLPEHEKWFVRDYMADPNLVHQWIGALNYDRILPLIAVKEDGAIIAIIRLHRRPAECLKHIAHLRIVVDPDYRQQRLGTWLLLDIVKLAICMGVEKLVAEFVAGLEDPAMNAASKLDFFEQAVLKDYVKDSEGRRHDLVVMIKTLHRDWSDF